MLLSEFLASNLSKKPFLVVLGHPVSHTRSPRIHNMAIEAHGINATYHAVDCPENECPLIPDLFSNPFFQGANVTIPLKKKIIDYVDEVVESARQIGAVNTVVPEKPGSNNDFLSKLDSRRLTGYNTDTYGFMKPLESLVPLTVATVLGTGGASKAICYALSKAGTKKIFLVSRSAGTMTSIVQTGNESESRISKTQSGNTRLESYCDICITIPYSELSEAVRLSDLVVNTTPAGMYPGIGSSPIPDHIVPELRDKICYDIIYNPLETKLLKMAKFNGAKVIGGLDMFVYQAARSFELWFNKQMPIEQVRDIMTEK